MADIIRPIEPFYVTQGFGENPASYAKFGLAGHNGWDLRTKYPETPAGKRSILASWLSQFYRHINDPNGYGTAFETLIQLKKTWKLTFGHCDHVHTFDTKNEGEEMAISDNTGYSTGAHLHLTVKPIRIENGKHINIEQNNGYFGAVDPQLFFDELREYKKSGKQPVLPGGSLLMEIDKQLFEKLVGNSGKWDGVVKFLNIDTNPDSTPLDRVTNAIQGLRSRETDLVKQLADAQTEVSNRTEQVSRLKDQLLSEEKLRKDATDKLISYEKNAGNITGSLDARLKEVQGQVDTLAKEKGDLARQLSVLEEENKILKNKTIQESKTVLTLEEVFSLLIKKFIIIFQQARGL